MRARHSRVSSTGESFPSRSAAAAATTVCCSGMGSHSTPLSRYLVHPLESHQRFRSGWSANPTGPTQRTLRGLFRLDFQHAPTIGIDEVGAAASASDNATGTFYCRHDRNLRGSSVVVHASNGEMRGVGSGDIQKARLSVVINVVDTCPGRKRSHDAAIVLRIKHDDVVSAGNENESTLAVDGNAARVIAGTPGRDDFAFADVNRYRLPGLLEVGVEAAVHVVDGVAFARSGERNFSGRGELGWTRGRKNHDGLVGGRNSDGWRTTGGPQLASGSNVSEAIGSGSHAGGSGREFDATEFLQFLSINGAD